MRRCVSTICVSATAMRSCSFFMSSACLTAPALPPAPPCCTFVHSTKRPFVSTTAPSTRRTLRFSPSLPTTTKASLAAFARRSSSPCLMKPWVFGVPRTTRFVPCHCAWPPLAFTLAMSFSMCFLRFWTRSFTSWIWMVCTALLPQATGSSLMISTSSTSSSEARAFATLLAARRRLASARAISRSSAAMRAFEAAISFTRSVWRREASAASVSAARSLAVRIFTLRGSPARLRTIVMLPGWCCTSRLWVLAISSNALRQSTLTSLTVTLPLTSGATTTLRPLKRAMAWMTLPIGASSNDRSMIVPRSSSAWASGVAGSASRAPNSRARGRADFIGTSP